MRLRYFVNDLVALDAREVPPGECGGYPWDDGRRLLAPARA